MAIVDVVKFDGTEDNNWLVWKYPSQELSTWTQLIVNPSQEALLVVEGKALDLFSSGRYTLETKNIPILSKLVNIPFGGKTPFTAEVWFINKTHVLDVKWGTRNPIKFQDPEYKILIPATAYGQFGVRISDARKFVIKLVGPADAFSTTTLVERFRGILLTRIQSIIAGYLIRDRIPIFDISLKLHEISEYITKALADQFDEYGVEILNFNVEAITFPDDDPSVMKLRDSLAEAAKIRIESAALADSRKVQGFTYQQERSFDVMQTAAGNEGQAGNLMGIGMGMGMGLGIGGALGTNMAGMGQGLQTGTTTPCPKCNAVNPAGVKFCASCGAPLPVSGQQAVPQGHTCDKCGTLIPTSAKFCPNCGDVYNPCPSCGADNPLEASQCVKCGKPMPRPCSACKAYVPPESKFCPECGTSQVNLCKNCKKPLKPNEKFCPECGAKAEG